MPRDYKKEYKDFGSKPKQKKLRAKRNAARKRAEKEGKVTKGDGKDVGHKQALSSGGSNSKKNTQVESRSANRAAGAKLGNKRKKAKKK